MITSVYMLLITFYIKNGNLKTFLTQNNQNRHQNAPNCSLLKRFLGVTCPRTHLVKLCDMQISKPEKKSCPLAKWWLICFMIYIVPLK